ncbi:MAG: hypothetical protein Q8N47_05005 [Bryobacterales bacterium]|nr:hypothetical protein [Bryobacterales bacterium]
MKLDLDHLKAEMEERLKARNFVVFRGHSRMAGSSPFVYWDNQQYPDFRMFLDTAEQAGVRLIVFHNRPFSLDYIDDAMERLEAAELPLDDQRPLERRLNALRAYEGFTCLLELSFDHQGRIYYFSLRTEWYEDLLDILDEIDASCPDQEEEAGEEPMGGYFSRN